MKRISPAGTRTPVCRQNRYRPWVEQLEDRLPTGVLLGLLAGPWAAVNPLWLEQASLTSEIAISERITDIGLLQTADDLVTFGNLDLGIAASDLTFQTIRYEYRNESAISFSPSQLAGRDRDDPTLPSLVKLLPLNPGERASGHMLGSADLAPSAAGALSAMQPTGNLPPRSDSRNTLSGASVPPAETALNQEGRLQRTSATATAEPVNQSHILGKHDRLPRGFEANQGQTDPQVQFISQGSAYTLFLTASEAVLSLQEPATSVDSVSRPVSPASAVLHMHVVGANAGVQAVGEEKQPSKVNYLLGRDPAYWHTDIPTFAKVEYPNIYDGINLLYYANQQQLEYDFILRPGADPAKITLGFAGADQLEISPQGDLVLHTATSTIRQHRPTIYQEVNGSRQEIVGGYVLEGPQQVGFQLGAYDPSRTLVIDPALAYSTYLGGSRDDVGNALAVDSAGNIYVTGDTTSTDFPTASPMQAAYGGGTSNAFVAKLDPTGSTLLYSTFLGGEGFDRGNGIAVDATGNAYIVGKTSSRMFPITRGAFEDTYRGDEFDAFVTKISPAGDHLIYSTYLGGNDNDAGIAIAVDSSGNAYVTGGTKSRDFPATQSAYQGANNGGTNAFVTELNATGTNVLYSTFLGGSFVDRGNAIAVDGNGFVYVTGLTDSDDFPNKNALQTNYGGGLDNAFVAKLNPQAAGDDSLIYATFLGGSGKDKGSGIAVDGAGNVYIAGETSSAANFPIVNALQPSYGGGTSNAFVAEINSAGTALVFATFLGGSGDDRASALALDANDNIYVTGSTSSPDFPLMNAFRPLLGGGSDAFVTKLTADGSALVYSTYLGGSGDENLYQNGINSGAIAVDAAGAVYVTGKTTSTDFPTVNPLQATLRGNTNAFLAKIVDPG